jgi:23S rRNA-/tRNA-specific pseudouridylate synthase
MKVLGVGSGWIGFDKPCGIASHATDRAEDDALLLAKRLLESESDLARKSGWDGFVSCAHRLDRETSGVLLVVTRKSCATELQEAFAPEKKATQKFYRAILRGRLKENSGTWAYPISDKSEGRDQPQGKSADRKAAETLFKVTQSGEHLTEVEIELRTGRQHQIRKHAALAGHAVVGDLRYSDKKYVAMIARRFNVERLFLHAEKLELMSSEFKIQLNAPLPKEFSILFGAPRD